MDDARDRTQPRQKQSLGTVVLCPMESGMTIIPFDDRDGWIWLDGSLVPWRDAKVHVLTHALHYGSSVFEGERAYGGIVFKSTAHSDRLIASGRGLDFEIPYNAVEIDVAKAQTIAANGLADAYLRPISWRGAEQLGVGAPRSQIHLAIAAWAWPSYFGIESKGVRLDIAEYRRPDPRTAPSQAKASGLYMICTISRHRAERRGYDDALMLDWQGRIAECTAANVFFVQDGALHTPIADCFLDGLTRRTVIDLARRRGIEVIERRIWPEELAAFSGAFLTGSAVEVAPIAEIGPYTFSVGALTAAIMTDFAAEVRLQEKAA